MIDEIEIQEPIPDRRYFTILPNVLDEMGLSPYAIRLYFRLKRRAGENGECWENSQHLAEGCNMSKSQISRTKAELEMAGLITIKKYSLGHGHFPGHLITIIDIWKRNVDYFDNKSIVPDRDRTCSPGNPRPVPLVVLKNIPIKESHNEKNPSNKLPTADDISSNPEAKNASDFDEKQVNGNLLNHQTVKDFKKITGFFPHKATRQLVIDTFPDGLDIDRARDAFTRWVALGANPKNIKWLLQNYRNDHYYEHPKDNAFWDEIQHPKEKGTDNY
jgi:hypothetical protein